MRNLLKSLFVWVAILLHSCGGAPEVPQEHTYQVTLSNGESYSGTIPNDELTALYTDIPGDPAYRLITFNILDDGFEMLVQVLMQGNAVLPIRDPESKELDGSFVAISPPGTNIFTGLGSVSGTVSASGLRSQATPGIGAGVSTGLIMGEFTFNCQFQRVEDIDSDDDSSISGTGVISIKNYF